MKIQMVPKMNWWKLRKNMKKTVITAMEQDMSIIPAVLVEEWAQNIILLLKRDQKNVSIAVEQEELGAVNVGEMAILYANIVVDTVHRSAPCVMVMA